MSRKQKRFEKKLQNAIKRDYHSEVKNEADHMIKNGLSEAIMGFNPQNIGVQLSQLDTIFMNNRWYLISNMRQILSEIYVEHGIIQTIVDVPVDDGLRGGVTIKTKQLDEDDIHELQAEMEQEDDFVKCGQGLKWDRLFGGAGILVITDQDYETPLDWDAIDESTPLEFRAVDMWELFWDKQNTEGYNPELQEQDYEFYNYYAKKVHKSRVFKMKGQTVPSFIRPRLRGWGISVVEKLVRSLNQYLKSTDLTFEVLDEFKVDVYKIKGMNQALLSPEGDAKIRKRIQLANQQKNYQNAIAMDVDDDFDQKELSFAGIAETQAGIRMQIASDLRMPLTKVFGISAAGFSSGEDDIENYNAMVESEIRSKIKHILIKMIKLRCKQKFGIIPDDLTIEFKPLRILSAEQEENVKSSKFNRLMAALDKGALSPKEFKEACNKDNLLGVQLDTDMELMTPMGDRDNRGNEDKVPENKAPESISASKPAPVAKNSTDQYGEYGGQLSHEMRIKKATTPEEREEIEMNIIQNPGKVDEGLWKKAKDASMKAFGRLKYAFVTYWYKKQGGKFE